MNKEMKNKLKKIRSMIEYIAMRVGIFILRLFPESLIRFCIGWFVSVIQFRRKVAEENLIRAYPDSTQKWRNAILKKMYFNYGLTAVETYVTPTKKLFPQMEDEEFRVVDEQLKKGKGVLIASGHLGNFEMAGRLMSHKLPLGVIIRRQHNPYFDAYANAERLKDKVTLIHAGKVLRPILKIMKKDGIVVIMTDQNARHHGYQLDFMGHPASTHIAIAKIAISFDIPVVLAGVSRNEKGYPHLIFRNLPDPGNYANDIDGHIEYMQKIQDAFAELVREYPEHWFWVHRRWRNAEKGKVIGQ